MTRNSYYYLLDENGHLTEDISQAIYVFIRDNKAYEEFWEKYRFSGLRGITDVGVWIYSEHMNCFIESSVICELMQIERWIENNADKAEFYKQLEDKK